MKKKAMLFMALFAIAGSANAQTFGLASDAVTVKQGLSAELKVNFTDTEEKYTAGQISVTLPAGVTISSATFYSERDYLDEGGNAHTVTVGAPDNTNTSILMIASTSQNLIYEDVTNGSSLLFTINLQASVDAVPGTYNGTMTGIRFSEPYNGVSDRYIDFADKNFTVVIEEGDIVTLDENSTTAPVAKSNVSVVLKRTMRTGGWNTFCVPFALTAAKVKELFGNDTKVCQFNSATTDTDGNITMAFTNWTRALAKNTPYLIKPGEGGSSYVIAGTDIDPAAVSLTKGDVTFVGSYVGGSTVPVGDYYLSNNKFYESAGLSTLGGFRGYFHVNSGSGARKLLLSVDGETTVIGDIEQDAANVGDIYDMTGRKVEKPGVGVYVSSGKKIVINRRK